jgi:hypothetical protein
VRLVRRWKDEVAGAWRDKGPTNLIMGNFKSKFGKGT